LLKKILIGIYCVFIVTSVIACDTLHNPTKNMENVDTSSTIGTLRVLDRTGNTGLNTFDLNPNSYDPDLSRIVENHVEAIPGVNEARVSVFSYHAFVGVDANDSAELLLHQQIYQAVQGQVAGREIRISDDPNVFESLGNVQHELHLGNR
jgi:hypothetical protein